MTEISITHSLAAGGTGIRLRDMVVSGSPSRTLIPSRPRLGTRDTTGGRCARLCQPCCPWAEGLLRRIAGPGCRPGAPDSACGRARYMGVRSVVLPLDAMLTSTVAPAPRAEGFKRKGRRFVIANDLGDPALIEISTSGKNALGDGRRHLWVRPWLLPEPFADLWQFRGAPYPAGWEQGLPLWDVMSRPLFCSPSATGSYGPRLWAFQGDDVTEVSECGQGVVRALVPEVVSTLRRLLDRQTLIEGVRRCDVLPGRGPEGGPLCLWGSGQGYQVLPLLADAGDVVAVADLLNSGTWLASSRAGNRKAAIMIGWASARLASRGSPNLQEFLTA